MNLWTECRDGGRRGGGVREGGGSRGGERLQNMAAYISAISMCTHLQDIWTC